MRKSPWIVAAAVGLVTALVPVAQGVAASMSSPITPPPPGTLPIDNFSDLASDSAHHHLFISSGWGSTGLLVTNESGTTVTTIPLAGASGMTLAGNLLFVAEANAAEIAVIDTSTLQVVRRVSTGANSCPQTVAVVASRYLVYGDACANEFGDIGVIDGRSATLTPATLTPVHGSYNPIVRVIPGTTRVVVADRGLSPSGVSIVDVAGTPSVVTSTWQLSASCSNLMDLAVSPDGSNFVPACGAPYEHNAYSTADLSQVGSYASHYYPDAAAFSANGKFFAGGTEASGLYLYAVSTSGHGAADVFNFPGEDSVAPSGLAFSTDGNKLFVVAEDFQNGWTYALHVISINPTSSSIALAAAPSWGVGTQLEVTGQLRLAEGGSQGDVPLTVTRKVNGVTTALAGVSTSFGAGDFTILDTPTTAGRTTYTVSYAGDAWHKATHASVTVNVTKIDPVMSVSTQVAVGGHATVTATLVGGSTNRNVTITATPRHGKPVQIASGQVDAFGELTATYTMSTTTTFTASYTGDAQYNRDSVHHTSSTKTSPTPPTPPTPPADSQRATIAIANTTPHPVGVLLSDLEFNQTPQVKGRGVVKPFDYTTRGPITYDTDYSVVEVLDGKALGFARSGDLFEPGHSYLVRVVYLPSVTNGLPTLTTQILQVG